MRRTSDLVRRARIGIAANEAGLRGKKKGPSQKRLGPSRGAGDGLLSRDLSVGVPSAL